jgi:hypothetical protein
VLLPTAVIWLNVRSLQQAGVSLWVHGEGKSSHSHNICRLVRLLSELFGKLVSWLCDKFLWGEGRGIIVSETKRD